ncbi:MAG TPA: aldo/keto reductase [Phycisphaerales bacterium]|nr:aldo/keto reductase [Phycisphaerales bacterium]
MIPQLPLGASGLSVSALGLGCMGMTDFYGVPDDEESLATFRRAVDLGINFFDTADVYGPHTNEELVGRALRSLKGWPANRDEFVIATKFGLVRGADRAWIGTRGDAPYVKACCDASLRRLGLDHIDLYFQHRVDAKAPIEETVGALKELVQQGKVRAIGLSEAGAETIRRAHAVHPVAALQTEYSLWSRDCEGTTLPVCRELGICFVAYSPLGRGMLTGTVTNNESFAPTDARRGHPRFQGENFEANLRLVEEVRMMGEAKGCSAAQLALAWVAAQNDAPESEDAAEGFSIVPIPGTKRRRYLEQNVAALDVHLSRHDLATLDRLFPPGAAAGERYPAHRMSEVGR